MALLVKRKKRGVLPRENSKVLVFPKTVFALRCRNCESNAFFVYLGSKDPYDINEVQCVDCKEFFSLKKSEV